MIIDFPVNFPDDDTVPGRPAIDMGEDVSEELNEAVDEVLEAVD